MEKLVLFGGVGTFKYLLRLKTALLILLASVAGCLPTTEETTLFGAITEGTLLGARIISPQHSSISGTTEIPADGTAISIITIILSDPLNQPLPGVMPTFSATDTLGANTYGPCSATDALGLSICTLASSFPETKTLLLTSPIYLTGQNIDFISAGASALTSTIAIIGSPTADGTDAATITVSLKDAPGNPISGITPILASTGSANTLNCGQTNASGVASCTIKSTKAEAKTITISSPTGLGLLSTDVTFVAGAVLVTNSSANPAPVTIAADGVQNAVVTVTLMDQYNNPVSGKSVTLASSRGVADVITSSPQDTNSSGVVSFSVSSTTLGISTITVTDATDAVLISNDVQLWFINATPTLDFRASLASSTMQPGENTTPISSWKNLSSHASTYDGDLQQFDYSSSSGWEGNGAQFVTSAATGPYRLAFDGSDDVVNFGTLINSSTNVTLESWVYPIATSARGKVLFSNADINNRGITVKQSNGVSSALEVHIGNSSITDLVYQDGAIAYWKFDESSGTVAKDSIGTYDGTYSATGVTKNQTSPISGRNISLNGTSGVVSLPAIDLSATKKVTVEFWYKPTNGTPQSGYILFENGTNYNFLSDAFVIYHDATGKVGAAHRALDQGYYVWESATVLASEVWHHLVVTYDKTAITDQIKVYINGSLDGTVHADPVYQSIVTNFYGYQTSFVGARNANTSFANGAFDELAVYSKVLTTSEILAHYQARLNPSCQSLNVWASSVWSHVSVVFDSSSSLLKLLVNGVEYCRVSTVLGTYATSTGDFTAGALSSGASAWTGSISDFQLYSSALTTPAVAQDMGVTKSRFPDFISGRPGLQLWLKADSLSSLSDGALVGAWTDSSDGANHVTQASEVAKPTYKIDQINGYPVIRFAGSQYLKTTNAALNLSSAFSVITVVKGNTVIQHQQAWMWGEVSNGKRRSLWLQLTNGYLNFSGYNSNVTTTTNVKDGTAHVISITQSVAGVVKVYLDRRLISSGSPSLNAYTYSGFVVGANIDGSETFVDDMAELVVYSDEMSLEELHRTHDYLELKYGL